MGSGVDRDNILEHLGEFEKSRQGTIRCKIAARWPKSGCGRGGRSARCQLRV